MVEFTLPANSKVQKGINHPIKEVSEKPKKLLFIVGILKIKIIQD